MSDERLGGPVAAVDAARVAELRAKLFEAVNAYAMAACVSLRPGGAPSEGGAADCREAIERLLMVALAYEREAWPMHAKTFPAIYETSVTVTPIRKTAKKVKR